MAAGSLLSSILWLAVIGGVAPARAQDWRVDSWIRVGGGNEEELLETPDMDRQLVPRGGFIEVAPGCAVSRPLEGGGLLRFGGGLWYEHFDTGSRRLFSTSLWSDLRHSIAGPLRLRVGGGGTFFDDSALASNRRLDGHGVIALGPAGRGWSIEAEATLRGRRYPELFVWTDSTTTAIYTESGWSAGGRIYWQPTGDFWLTLRGGRTGTDALDHYYDIRALRGEAAAGVRPWRDTWFLVNLHAEERDYYRRDASIDPEHWLTVGGGLDWQLSAPLLLSLRYAFSVYDGDDDRIDTHRIGASITWRFGRGGSRPAAPLRRLDLPEPPPDLLDDEALRFEIGAPDAESVSLVGDFNGWDRAAHPMKRGPQGSWSIAVVIPAGVYQYAYFIDGENVTPPEANEFIDDGFGSRNALLRIFVKSKNSQ